MLPSFLFIFLLKKLFYFLWFPEIWYDWCPVVIEAQPDVFTDLQGGRGMRRVGGKQRIGVGMGVLAKPGQRWEKNKGKGVGLNQKHEKSQESGMPVKLTKQSAEKCQDPSSNSRRTVLAVKH